MICIWYLNKVVFKIALDYKVWMGSQRSKSSLKGYNFIKNSHRLKFQIKWATHSWKSYNTQEAKILQVRTAKTQIAIPINKTLCNGIKWHKISSNYNFINYSCKGKGTLGSKCKQQGPKYNQICLEESERCSEILDIYFETLTNCLNGRLIVAKELSDCKVDLKKLIRSQSKRNQKVYKAQRIGQEGVQHGTKISKRDHRQWARDSYLERLWLRIFQNCQKTTVLKTRRPQIILTKENKSSHHSIPEKQGQKENIQNRGTKVAQSLSIWLLASAQGWPRGCGIELPQNQ